ncbi:sigma-70 family RNA polymerase sigma factor [Salinibacillus xinjiangensis]|uniref:Sigma-70 family RNA polymerase sigma factor n=1 Tax=Salinibacillus xinjiangensis TaxID=1229268 RepID=A0A6G1X2S5_9BACI|nr:sigma-70 family RNA polymerase sigma factor [Salinibacillus xinjiangensis]MRG85293.1 sigma-70 family RNA polymerase sigma factor [Salinibacillus xinjiangensis]
MQLDRDLVQKARDGDDEAFLTIMQQYKTDLYKTALAYFRNENDAIEAVQEVTFRAYKKIKTLREPAYFKTWIIRIMINYCNDQVRKRKRLVFEQSEIEKTETQDNHTRIELEDAMLELDDQSRELLMLKYFHDLKIKDIAKVLRKPEGTVKTWLNKALKTLKGTLED